MGNKKSAGLPLEEAKRRATAAAAEGKRVPSAPSSFPLGIITEGVEARSTNPTARSTQRPASSVLLSHSYGGLLSSR